MCGWQRHDRMSYSDYLTLASLMTTLMGVIVTAIAVLFVILGYLEYSRLRQLRKDFDAFRDQLAKDQHRMQKAQQRIIASYNVADIDRRIALLKSAVELDPGSFNGYSALGYAYLDKGDEQAALDAFNEAIHQHPEAKEGYFDLAYFYLRKNHKGLCKRYLKRAIDIDPSSQQDIDADERLREVMAA